jgi:glutamyl-tRNA synthetase
VTHQYDIPVPHFNKTRFAPTPSGYLHLGNVLSFAITAMLAKKTGAKILLRIDDLDRDRINTVFVQDIFDTLDFMGIPWDEGPRDFKEYGQEWSQLHRMDIYRKALQQLRDTGAVFACSCSRAQIRAISPDDTYPGTCRDKQIPLNQPDVTWRLKTDELEKLNIKTYPSKITSTVLPTTMRDFVLRKKDGYPAYQLASLLDDVHFGVDLIVRGEDLWPSTLAQHYLSGCLGADAFRDSTFYHHPLLMAQENAKLSKSAGATSVRYLRQACKKPGDIYTAIAGMLGFKQPVTCWQELAGLVITDNPL